MTATATAAVEEEVVELSGVEWRGYGRGGVLEEAERAMQEGVVELVRE